jgi:uncharacterized membrane protein YgcG
MKKSFVVAISLMLITCAFGADAEILQHIYDQAGTFSARDTQFLEAEMQAMYDEFGFDSIIVTTENSFGKPTDLYAADFYESVRDEQKFDNYVAFAFAFDVGERGAYGEAAYGPAEQKLTRRGDDDLYEILAPYLPSRDYGSAMRDYVAYLRDVMTPRSSFAAAADYLVFILPVALIVSLIIVFIMKGGMKTAKNKVDASFYVVSNSLNLLTANDIYLYETVTRTKIETPSGGSGGGGRSFSSGSGRSYGGRSGRL